MLDETTTIELNDEMDRWRYRCPRGHTTWEPTNNHFWCAECAKRYGDVDPAFDELHDQQSGEVYERDQVQLLTKAGPYDHGSSA